MWFVLLVAMAVPACGRTYPNDFVGSSQSLGDESLGIGDGGTPLDGAVFPASRRPSDVDPVRPVPPAGTDPTTPGIRPPPAVTPGPPPPPGTLPPPNGTIPPPPGSGTTPPPPPPGTGPQPTVDPTAPLPTTPAPTGPGPSNPPPDDAGVSTPPTPTDNTQPPDVDPPVVDSGIDPECIENAHCQDDAVCISEQCVYFGQCLTDTHCGVGRTCEDNLCRGGETVPRREISCEINADCPERFYCVGGRCELGVECTKHAHCPPQEACLASICVSAVE